MKYIIILLALVFQMSCSNDNKSDDSKKNQEATQATPEQNYQTGLKYDLAENYTQAFEYIQKAADQGHANAQLRLAEMYEHGQGVEQDDEQTAYWRKKADPKFPTVHVVPVAPGFPGFPVVVVPASEFNRIKSNNNQNNNNQPTSNNK